MGGWIKAEIRLYSALVRVEIELCWGWAWQQVKSNWPSPIKTGWVNLKHLKSSWYRSSQARTIQVKLGKVKLGRLTQHYSWNQNILSQKVFELKFFCTKNCFGPKFFLRLFGSKPKLWEKFRGFGGFGLFFMVSGSTSSMELKNAIKS